MRRKKRNRGKRKKVNEKKNSLLVENLMKKGTHTLMIIKEQVHFCILKRKYYT